MLISFIAPLILTAIAFLFYFILFRRRKKSLPVSLYFEALRMENAGDFGQAEKGYQAALEEASKFRYHEDLKKKIEEKIRLMHTVTTYQRSISFAAFNHSDGNK